MQDRRFSWFLICILIGVAGGLAFGWAVHPLEANNSAPEMLREDYKTDYVLMVAEVYKTEKDTGLAAHRLALLSDQPALRIVQQAIITAGGFGYHTADLDLLAQLAQGLSQPPQENHSGAATPGGGTSGGQP